MSSWPFFPHLSYPGPFSPPLTQRWLLETLCHSFYYKPLGPSLGTWATLGLQMEPSASRSLILLPSVSMD